MSSDGRSVRPTAAEWERVLVHVIGRARSGDQEARNLLAAVEPIRVPAGLRDAFDRAR